MKKINLLFLLLLFLGSCKPTSNIVTSKNEATKRRVYTGPENKKKVNSSYLAKQLVLYASESLGSPYRYGGATSEGYDCSGLMYSSFKKFNIILPRSSIDMSKIGRKLDKDEIQKGDLLFFKTNGKSVINHVGMVTEILDDEIKFIHASTTKGVILSSTKEVYYQRSFVQANRILE